MEIKRSFFLPQEKKTKKQAINDMERLNRMIALLYPPNEHDGYLVFASKEHFSYEEKNEIKQRTYMKNIFYNSINDYTNGDIPDFQFRQKKDYYMSVNPMCAFKVNSASLFSYNVYMIDIDAHVAISPEFMADCLKQAIDQIFEILDEKGIPYPNVVTYTGRGMQICWSLKQMSYLYPYKYNEFGEYIDRIVKDGLYRHRKKYTKNDFKYFTKDDMEDIVHIDATSRTHASGYMRVPMSYNTQAKTYGKMKIIHEEQIDLMEFCERIPKEKKNKKKKAFYPGNYRVIGENRYEGLLRLLEKRQESGEWGKEGYRNNLLFAVSGIFGKNFSDDEIKEMMMNVNDMLPDPLPEKKIDELIQYAQKKNVCLTNKFIINFLGLSEDEIELTGIGKTSKKTHKDKDHNFFLLSDEQKDMIRELCEKGYTKAQIAKTVGCSKTHVGKLLKDYGMTTKKEVTAEYCKQLIRKGKLSMKEIQEQTGLSLPSVYRIRKNMQKEQEKKQQEKEERKKKREERKKEREEAEKHKNEKKEKAKKETKAEKKMRLKKEMVLQLHKEKVSPVMIRKKTKLSLLKVYEILSEAGFGFEREIRDIKEREKLKRQVRELMDQKMKPDEIVRKLNVYAYAYDVYKIYNDTQRYRTNYKNTKRKKQRGTVRERIRLLG